MIAEKYVGKIVRKLKCSRKRQVEIRRQLLSDIEAELESGETFETVMERMGTPTNVAQEFNQDMPEEEKRCFVRRRRLKFIGVLLAVIFLAGVLLYWFFPKAGALTDGKNFRQSDVEAMAQNVIRLLNENDLDTLRQEATGLIVDYLTSEKLDEARSTVAQEWGDFQKFGRSYMSEIVQQGKAYAAIELTAQYEHVMVTYTLSFDEEMRLCALYMK